MTITVTLNTLGILRAIDVVTTARTDAVLRRETEPHVVSVEVGAASGPDPSARPTGQARVVDLVV